MLIIEYILVEFICTSFKVRNLFQCKCIRMWQSNVKNIRKDHTESVRSLAGADY